MNRSLASLVLFGATCFLVAPSTSFAAQLTISNQVALPGMSIQVPVNLGAQGSTITGMQFDIQFDDAVLSVSATLGNSANSAGKQLYSSNVAVNTLRCVIVGLNQTAIADGSVVNLMVEIAATAGAGVDALNLANVSATDAMGQAIPISAAGGAITVQSTPTLQLNGLVNAASWQSGPVAAGEIITVLGSAIGPVPSQQSSGAVIGTKLGGVSLLFDGTPAPLLYASSNQINAVVPYEVDGKTVTQVQVQFGQILSSAIAVAVDQAAPALFTLNSSGTGSGAILNQNSTVNSPSNPATVGSVISLYATGAGQTNPPGVDGQIAGSILALPLLPVSVQIGGINATVLYAGAAPGLVAGSLQVNVRVPNGVSTGLSIPVLLTVGMSTSPSGVTVAIQ